VLKKLSRDLENDPEARKKAVRKIRGAFRELGLDHNKPADWGRLRAVVFETQKQKLGAPPKWLWDALLALGFAYEAVCRERSPKTLRRAATLILERYPEFKSIAGDERALARRLPLAIQRYRSWMQRPRPPTGIEVVFSKNRGGVEVLLGSPRSTQVNDQ
jgi:hypothetical protein